MLGQGSTLAANMVSVSYASLVGVILAPSPSLATLPQALLLVATALTTGPISGLMGRFGRRAGFLTGAGLALVAVALSLIAILSESFLLFCLSTFILGSFNAAGQYYRFAAAESVSIDQAPKAISMVLLGGILAALTVPTVVGWVDGYLKLPNHAGAFAAVTIYVFIAIAAAFKARFSEPSRSEGAVVEKISLRDVFARPAFLVGAVTTAGAQGLMNLLMTATPLAMSHAGHQAHHSTEVIQAHIIAMFLPSLFSGWLIAKLGVGRVVSMGIAAMIACIFVARAGLGVGHFTLSLILLGLGWNFLFVSGTAIVAGCHGNHERSRFQGVNEMMVFGISAVTALASGALFNALGWAELTLTSVVILALVAFVNVARVVRQKRLSSQA